MKAAVFISIALWAAAGFGFGLAHFAALRANVARYAAGDRARAAILIHVGRLALAAAAFWLAALYGGALALLAGLAGFLVARFVAVRHARETR